MWALLTETSIFELFMVYSKRGAVSNSVFFFTHLLRTCVAYCSALTISAYEYHCYHHRLNFIWEERQGDGSLRHCLRLRLRLNSLTEVSSSSDSLMGVVSLGFTSKHIIFCNMIEVTPIEPTPINKSLTQGSLTCSWLIMMKFGWVRTMWI